MELEEAEITSLRNELDQARRQMFDTTKLSVMVTIGVLGFGLSAPSPASASIVMMPTLLLYVSFFLILNRGRRVVVLKTYLRAFASPKFRFEARLHKSKLESDHEDRWLQYTRVVGWVFCILELLCFGCSWFLLSGEGNEEYQGKLSACFLIWCMFKLLPLWCARSVGGNAEDEAYATWIRTAEGEAPSTGGSE